MNYSTVLRIVRIGIFFGILGGFVVGGLFLYQFLYAPRMKNQPHLRAYEAIMPPPPPGSVPLSPLPALPSAEEVSQRSNPLPPTAGNIARGKVYYAYYCLTCHGEHGDGNGPVGQSYMPVPADLRTPKIREYDDGRLLRAMLAGTGHEPVLPRVVPPEHRWHLVLFLRNLKAEGGLPGNRNMGFSQGRAVHVGK